MFAGNCTSNVQFYAHRAYLRNAAAAGARTQTTYNYGRVLSWAAAMIALSQLHPSFASVFLLEAVNEPIEDASKTPGYGDRACTSPPLPSPADARTRVQTRSRSRIPCAWSRSSSACSRPRNCRARATPRAASSRSSPRSSARAMPTRRATYCKCARCIGWVCVCGADARARSVMDVA
jgi:hypothetical protein